MPSFLVKLTNIIQTDKIASTSLKQRGKLQLTNLYFSMLDYFDTLMAEAHKILFQHLLSWR